MNTIISGHANTSSNVNSRLTDTPGQQNNSGCRREGDADDRPSVHGHHLHHLTPRKARGEHPARAVSLGWFQTPRAPYVGHLKLPAGQRSRFRQDPPGATPTGPWRNLSQS